MTAEIWKHGGSNKNDSNKERNKSSQTHKSQGQSIPKNANNPL